MTGPHNERDKTMKQDDYETAVIFRRERDGTILALMPELPADYNGFYVTCYAHVGQHGSADFNGMIASSKPANAAEYADLKAELEQIGYRVTPYKRRTTKHRDAFRRNLREQR